MSQASLPGMEKQDPMEAIAAFCRDCLCDSCLPHSEYDQIRGCPESECKLWHHRPGNDNPGPDVSNHRGVASLFQDSWLTELQEEANKGARNRPETGRQGACEPSVVPSAQVVTKTPQEAAIEQIDGGDGLWVNIVEESTPRQA
jgi:hypothetical protein